MFNSMPNRTTKTTTSFMVCGSLPQQLVDFISINTSKTKVGESLEDIHNYVKNNISQANVKNKMEVDHSRKFNVFEDGEFGMVNLRDNFH